MNNPEKLATLGTHHTGQRDKNKTLKTKIMNNKDPTKLFKSIWCRKIKGH
jgi:hypothetical protein